VLKRHQVERARELGAERIDWTFDPLVARNAHLNINRLGVDVRAYAPDMYSGTGSDLHVFGTDRLIVSLSTARRRPPRPRVDDEVASAAPFLNADASGAVDGDALRCAYARIRIPVDITEIAACDPAAARAWRDSTRAAFTRAFAEGYRVVQLHAEDGGDPAYVLARPT
jgi:predicted GNAT superfamily acetyltransferase